MEGRKQPITNIISNQAEGRCTAECKQWQKVRTARGDLDRKLTARETLSKSCNILPQVPTTTIDR